uniref:Transmembrane protein n=1 Tax=Plectus sambesii TaxID=2011161 RepID=A0A914XFC7_9BILA
MTTPVRRVRFRSRHVEHEVDRDDDSDEEGLNAADPDHQAQRGDWSNKRTVAQSKEIRRIRIDDVLWLLALILTIWYFDVPCTLWFDPRIRWTYLQASAALWLGFFAIGIFFIAILGQAVEPDDWRRTYPRLFPLATSLFLLSCITFCYAVWPVWSGWSLLIVFVCSVASIIIVSLFP